MGFAQRTHGNHASSLGFTVGTWGSRAGAFLRSVTEPLGGIAQTRLFWGQACPLAVQSLPVVSVPCWFRVPRGLIWGSAAHFVGTCLCITSPRLSQVWEPIFWETQNQKKKITIFIFFISLVQRVFFLKPQSVCYNWHVNLFTFFPFLKKLLFSR